MKGDYLSRLLQTKDIGIGLILIGVVVAFGLGAVHALSPGHGKTIVAAYLVGSRGTLKHALFLGFTVTFTHTFSVFMLGLGVLFLQKYIVPEKIIPILGAISGLSIVAVGAWLLYQRTKALLIPQSAHGHSHGMAIPTIMHTRMTMRTPMPRIRMTTPITRMTTRTITVIPTATGSTCTAMVEKPTAICRPRTARSRSAV